MLPLNPAACQAILAGTVAYPPFGSVRFPPCRTRMFLFTIACAISCILWLIRGPVLSNPYSRAHVRISVSSSTAWQCWTISSIALASSGSQTHSNRLFDDSSSSRGTLTTTELSPTFHHFKVRVERECLGDRKRLHYGEAHAVSVTESVGIIPAEYLPRSALDLRCAVENHKAEAHTLSRPFVVIDSGVSDHADRMPAQVDDQLGCFWKDVCKSRQPRDLW